MDNGRQGRCPQHCPNPSRRSSHGRLMCRRRRASVVDDDIANCCSLEVGRSSDSNRHVVTVLPLLYAVSRFEKWFLKMAGRKKDSLFVFIQLNQYKGNYIGFRRYDIWD